MRPAETDPVLRARLALYGSAFVLGYIAILAIQILRGALILDEDGRPIASDYVNFWGAGLLVLEGRPADVYDWALHRQAQIAGLGRDFEGLLAFLNPPHLLLAAAPFALLPYALSWILFVLLTAAFFAATLRLVVPGFAIPALLAAPAGLWSAAVGQNGFLTAALLTAGLALLDRHPRLAGLCIGLLTYKPQFGLLIPLFLLLDRRWDAFAAAAATAIGLVLLSGLAFGWDTWTAFLGSVGPSGRLVMDGGAGWEKFQTVYALAFQVLGDQRAAMAAHGLAVAVLAVVLARHWLGPASAARKAAALAAACYLAAPYAYIYDAVLLTVAAAFLVRDGLENGFGRLRVVLIFTACLLPAVFTLLGSLAGLMGAGALLFAALTDGQRRGTSGAPRAV